MPNNKHCHTLNIGIKQQHTMQEKNKFDTEPATVLLGLICGDNNLFLNQANHTYLFSYLEYSILDLYHLVCN